jgi:hypothetical protein
MIIELSEEERATLLPRVLEQLQPGKTNSRTVRQLMPLLKVRDERRIRQAVLELIQQGHPIAASNGQPQGYYLVTNWEEANEYMANLKSRMSEIAVRLHAFVQATKKLEPHYEHLPLFGGSL